MKNRDEILLILKKSLLENQSECQGTTQGKRPVGTETEPPGNLVHGAINDCVASDNPPQPGRFVHRFESS